MAVLERRMYSEYPQPREVMRAPLTWGEELQKTQMFENIRKQSREVLRHGKQYHGHDIQKQGCGKNSLARKARTSKYRSASRNHDRKHTSRKSRHGRKITARLEERDRSSGSTFSIALADDMSCSPCSGTPHSRCATASVSYSNRTTSLNKRGTADEKYYGSADTSKQNSRKRSSSRDFELKPYNTYRNRRDSITASPSYDSDEDYRRSRSRERHRRHQQYLTIQKYCKNEDDSLVFWDGFQWVKKGQGAPGYDQLMNATRRARRLHIDRGGNFGFMEMASVEEAIAALQLDGFMWHGIEININRPTDWKRGVNDQAIRILAGSSGLAVAESVAAATQQAVITGNSSGLASVLSHLPEDHRKNVTEMMKQPSLSFNVNDMYRGTGLPLQLVKNRIRAELLKGCPSRVIRISKPFSNLESEAEFSEVLEDVMGECSKHGGIIAAIIITPKLSSNLKYETGDIFLEFACISQADQCILNLSGRMYEGKPIQMHRYSERNWQLNLKPYSENILLKSLDL
ncbi:putative splicing factor [Cardiosporidium cionae]|uniref:Splicing factor n=1 Tax=Cardiosporidium cionae TaxID=476202 RepID=A0ABQ7JEU0_9APIC|nr:putative splicing factor [Cardiosporidium cionae]|eukprot:KAF8822527.1 putative splicing factor [Cardiosporidium cionae]